MMSPGSLATPSERRSTEVVATNVAASPLTSRDSTVNVTGAVDEPRVRSPPIRIRPVSFAHRGRREIDRRVLVGVEEVIGLYVLVTFVVPRDECRSRGRSGQDR